MEIWKTIEGYENYEISNKGRVRNIKTGKIRKHGYTLKGYQYVPLSKNGISKNKFIHRLVAHAFCEGYKEGLQVDHINTIKDDNRAENLRWVTPKENSNNPLTLKHNSDSNKGKQLGEKSPRSKNVVGFGLNNVLKFSSTREAGRNGFTSGNVAMCCRGGLNKHKNYIWYYLEDLLYVYFEEGEEQ